MNVYEIGNMGQKLANNTYPGRGIVLGITPDGSKAVAVLPGDTPETLQKRIMEQAEWILLPEAVKAFCEDRITVSGRTVIIK